MHQYIHEFIPHFRQNAVYVKHLNDTFHQNRAIQNLKMSIRVLSRVVSLASLCPVLLLQTSMLARKAAVHLTVRDSQGSCRKEVRSWKSSGLHRDIWELTAEEGGSV